MRRIQKKLRTNPLRGFDEGTVIESALFNRGGLTRKFEIAFIARGKVHSVDNYGDDTGLQRAWDFDECVSFVTRTRAEPTTVHERGDGVVKAFPELVGNRVMDIHLMDGRVLPIGMSMSPDRLVALNAADNVEWVHREDVMRWSVPGACTGLTGYHREAGKWFVRRDKRV